MVLGDISRLPRQGKKEANVSLWSARKVVLLGIRSEDYRYRMRCSLRGVAPLA
jgi:hypothetical protein